MPLGVPPLKGDAPVVSERACHATYENLGAIELLGDRDVLSLYILQLLLSCSQQALKLGDAIRNVF